MTPTLNYITVLTAILTATAINEAFGQGYAFMGACLAGAIWGIMAIGRRWLDRTTQTSPA